MPRPPTKRKSTSESQSQANAQPRADTRYSKRDLHVIYSGWGEKALRAPYYRDPLMTVAQEPSIVRLPDQRLFCVMRRNSGYIWYSVSRDDGENWISPRPLLRKDFGEPILQPVSCSPIYRLADGRYVLLHHDNRGAYTEKPQGHLRTAPARVYRARRVQAERGPTSLVQRIKTTHR